MNKTWAIFGKEVKLYFLSPVAYIIMAGFVLFSAASFYFRATGFPDMIVAARDSGLLDTVRQNRINYFVLGPVLSDASSILIFLIPLITMRLWAEEKRGSTDELLITSPVSVGKIVMGKYLAGLLFVLVLLAVTLVYTVFLFVYSAPDPGVTLSSYIALILFVAAGVGIGLFASSLTENQIVASVTCLIIELFFASMGGVATSVRPPLLSDILGYISWREHMMNFFDGVIRSGDVVYFITFTFLWLFLAYQSIESSRWR